MKQTFLQMLALVFFLSACAPAITESPPLATEIVQDLGMPVPPAQTPLVVAERVASQTHSNLAGYSFDYPLEWQLDEVVGGDRAPSIVQLTSWAHLPGLIDAVAEGGTVVNVTLQLWNPSGDLAAFAAIRKQAWDASGIGILSEQDVALADGRLAQEFIVQSTDGQAYFLFTTFGENYLVVSGSGDLETIRSIAHSLR